MELRLVTFGILMRATKSLRCSITEEKEKNCQKHKENLKDGRWRFPGRYLLYNIDSSVKTPIYPRKSVEADASK